MRIEMIKFGRLLNSRPAGREAALRIVQMVNGSTKDKEEIILDFAEVEILTPSFADELLHLLKEKYKNKEIKLENTETPVVRDTLKVVSAQ